MRILIALVVLAVTVPSADAAVTTFRVPGGTESLALDGSYAFVIRRARKPEVVRVDLETGRRDVIFRTTSFPAEVLYAANGSVGLGLDVPVSDRRVNQVVRIPAAGGPAVVVREGRATYEPECGTGVHLNGMTSAGELLVSEAVIPCGADRGTLTLTAVGPSGDRPLGRRPADQLEDVGWGLGEIGPTAYDPAARWRLLETERGVRVHDTATGARREYRTTLGGDTLLDAVLGPDGQVLLTERRLRRRGGLLQRVRLAGPDDPPRGGDVLGTVGSPPRLNATWCGDRLLVLRTVDRRTRVFEGAREIARVSTQADPRVGCTAERLLVEGGLRDETTFHVIALR